MLAAMVLPSKNQKLETLMSFFQEMEFHLHCWSSCSVISLNLFTFGADPVMAPFMISAFLPNEVPVAIA